MTHPLIKQIVEDSRKTILSWINRWDVNYRRGDAGDKFLQSHHGAGYTIDIADLMTQIDLEQSLTSAYNAGFREGGIITLKNLPDITSNTYYQAGQKDFKEELKKKLPPKQRTCDCDSGEIKKGIILSSFNAG